MSPATPECVVITNCLRDIPSRRLMGVSKLTSKTELLTAPSPQVPKPAAPGSFVLPAAQAKALSHPWLLTLSHTHIPSASHSQWLSRQHPETDPLSPPRLPRPAIHVSPAAHRVALPHPPHFQRLCSAPPSSQSCWNTRDSMSLLCSDPPGFSSPSHSG